MKPKQAIVLRSDLNMPVGKLIAQGSHASLKVFLDKSLIDTVRYSSIEATPELRLSFKIDTEHEFDWLVSDFTKVIFGANTEREILEIYSKAKEANLPCSYVEDQSRLVFGKLPTITAVAIGPGDGSKIDIIVGDLCPI